MTRQIEQPAAQGRIDRPGRMKPLTPLLARELGDCRGCQADGDPGEKVLKLHADRTGWVLGNPVQSEP